MQIETYSGHGHKMIELKARVGNQEFLRKKLSALGAQHLGTFSQTDLYFKVPEGRFKLREVEDSCTVELIYYKRENTKGPRKDDVFILTIQEPAALKRILKKILTPLTVVKKVREIYQYQGTKIHLDTLKKLGNFVEFERKSSDDQAVVRKDQQILENLMKKLAIDPSTLEALSYSDLSQTWSQRN